MAAASMEKPIAQTHDRLPGAARLIVVPDDFPSIMADSNAIARLKRVPGVTVKVFPSPPSSEAELASRIASAHTVIFSHSSLSASPATLARSSSLRHVILTGSSHEEVQHSRIVIPGVKVTVATSPVADSVAEHALSLMLALAHKVPELDQRVRAGEWPRGLITQLSGKVLGIVGSSGAATKLGRLAAGIGMNVIQWRHADDSGAGGASLVLSLEDLLSRSDVVSVHSRIAVSGPQAIGARHFAQMKPSAFLVAADSSGLVDERALVVALTTQVIAGADSRIKRWSGTVLAIS